MVSSSRTGSRTAYRGARAHTLLYLSGEVGGPTLAGAPDLWIEAALQPAGRVLIGVWLWRVARETEALP